MIFNKEVYSNKINNINKKQFLLLSCVILVFYLIIQRIFSTYGINNTLLDTLWQYNQAKRIADGYTVYNDFNMLTTPLYYFLSAISLKINKSLLSKLLFDDILVFFNNMCYLFFIKRFIKQNTKSLFVFILYIFLYGFGFAYNGLVITFLLLSFAFLLDNRHFYLIGVFASLAFFTKQTIGGLLLLYLFIDILFTNRDKLLKFLLGCISVFGIFLLYFLFTKSLLKFIDYCFLGAASFKDVFEVGNHLVFGSILVIIIFTNISVLLFNKSINKLLKIRLTLSMLITMVLGFPILDFRHLLPALSLSLFVIAYIDVKDSLMKLVGCLNVLFIVYFSLNNFGIMTDYEEYYFKYLDYSSLDDYLLPLNNRYEESINKAKNVTNKNIVCIYPGFSVVLNYYDCSSCYAYDLFLTGNIGSKSPIELVNSMLNDNNVIMIKTFYEDETKGQFPYKVYWYLHDNAELVFNDEQNHIEYYQLKD